MECKITNLIETQKHSEDKTKQPSKIVINYNYLTYFDIISYLQQISKTKWSCCFGKDLAEPKKRFVAC